MKCHEAPYVLLPDGHRTRRVPVRNHLPRSTDIVEMFENEVEIAKLAAPLQISHALTDDKCVVRCGAPSFDQAPGRVIFRSEAVLNQAFRDPGTTHLVLFSEVAACSSTDDCDCLVVVC